MIAGSDYPHPVKYGLISIYLRQVFILTVYVNPEIMHITIPTFVPRTSIIDVSIILARLLPVFCPGFNFSVLSTGKQGNKYHISMCGLQQPANGLGFPRWVMPCFLPP